MVLVPKAVEPGVGERRPECPAVVCATLSELARVVGEYRRSGGHVFQFDDAVHYQVGFVAGDNSVRWLLPVNRFFRHFDTKKAGQVAFQHRRDFVFELGDELLGSR